MNTIILGGFLGSGKTTTLMQFARYLVDISDPDLEYKVVILENEVGKIGIDDQYLRNSGFTVNNLFAGCACCTVSSELITSVGEIVRTMTPEWLVVETTGIAYPGLMRENLQNALHLESRVCVLTDASRWARLRIPMEALLQGQIECADIVLINKIDLSDDESLERIEADIHGFNADVPIVRISALSEVPNEVWHSIVGVWK
ncbi:MAG: cobalamin biosynthesis protein P47K [Oscillospiraceae bacterium]|nr:cobalamin biosynthesis protein P47K [Oscillospiraceae bacterium]